MYLFSISGACKYTQIRRVFQFITTLGDLTVRVRGSHFLFSSVHPDQLPQRQTATVKIKQEAAPIDPDYKINKHVYDLDFMLAKLFLNF